jgi:hypothetical protein
MIAAAKQMNLALAFLLEIGVLGALGTWGFQAGSGPLARIGIGIGAPLIAVGVWAVFGAPRSTRRLHGPGLLALRIVFFGSGTVALWVANHHSLTLLFAIVSAVNIILIYAWEQYVKVYLNLSNGQPD